MPSPTFLCIGAQKCGTSWLEAVVRQHPHVCTSHRKEVHFFNKPERFARGQEWYEAQFSCLPLAQAVGEFTPNYIWTVGDPAGAIRCEHILGSADRIADAYPDLRLIVCLRDPVDRAVSGYYHAVRAGRVRPGRPLLEAANERSEIKEFGNYAANISRWFERFPRNAFLFLIYEEDIRPDSQKCDSLRRVFDHIGVDPTYIPTQWNTRHNDRSSYYEMRIRQFHPLVAAAFRRLPRKFKEASYWEFHVSNADRGALAREYAPDVAQLEALLGRTLPWLDTFKR